MTHSLKLDRLEHLRPADLQKQPAPWSPTAQIAIAQLVAGLRDGLLAAVGWLRSGAPSIKTLDRHMLNDIGITPDDPGRFSVDEIRRRGPHF